MSVRLHVSTQNSKKDEHKTSDNFGIEAGEKALISGIFTYINDANLIKVKSQNEPGDTLYENITTMWWCSESGMLWDHTAS